MKLHFGIALAALAFAGCTSMSETGASIAPAQTAMAMPTITAMPADAISCVIGTLAAAATACFIE